MASISLSQKRGLEEGLERLLQLKRQSLSQDIYRPKVSEDAAVQNRVFGSQVDAWAEVCGRMFDIRAGGSSDDYRQSVSGLRSGGKTERRGLGLADRKLQIRRI